MEKIPNGVVFADVLKWQTSACVEYGEGKFLILFQSSGLFVVNYCAMLVFKNEENSVQQQLFFLHSCLLL